MESEYFKQIKLEIGDFEHTQPDYNPSYAPNQSDVINLVDLYWSSKFKDGDNDAAGYKKAFYNIIMKPIYVAQKLVDLDTKDFRVVAEDGVSYFPSWFFSKELKLWMKNKKNQYGQTFGQLLNEIVFKWPKYGHIILKKAKDTVFVVPVQNFINNPKAASILKSEYIIEKHPMGHQEFMSQSFPDKNENDLQAIWDKYNKDGEIMLYERIGECDCMAGHNYHILPDNCESDNDILFHDTVKVEDIYRELIWEQIPGRALGRGQAEKLFENQIAKNTDENLFRTALRWTSKRIFQSKDENIARNLLSEIENGELVIAQSEITPIAMEERNLLAYRHSDAKWDANTADNTSSYESISGERPPAGTPLGTTILQSQQAGAFFDQRREDLGMFLHQVLFDWIIPEFKKDKKNKHSLMLGEFDEDEVEKLRRLVSNYRFNQSVIRFIKKNGYYPDRSEMKILKGIVKEQIKKSRELELPDAIYENIRYTIDILITNEQIDMAARLSTLQTVFQILGSNPTILQDSKTRKVFYMLLDLSGISPLQLEIEESEPDLLDEARQLRAERGGSIARGRPVGTPSVLPAEAMV